MSRLFAYPARMISRANIARADKYRLSLIALATLCGQIVTSFTSTCFAVNIEDQREYSKICAIPDNRLKLKRLNQYLLAHPNAARLYGYRAELDNALGLVDETIADASKYFQLNREPVVAQICKVRAQSYLKKGEDKKALADLVWAKKLAPRDGEAALMLGIVLERLGRNKEALAEFGRSIELKCYRAYVNSAGLKLRLGLMKEGLADSLAYMRLTKDLSIQDGIVNDFTQQKRYQELVLICDGFIDAGQAKPNVYASKASALFSLGRYDEALQACDQSGKSCGDQLDMQRLHIYAEQKQQDKVIAQLRRLIKANPQDLRLYLWRADSFMLQRHYDLALADFVRADALIKKDKAAVAKRAECYFRLGKYEEAKRDYVLVNGTIANVETLSYEALCRKGIKDYGGAVDCFTRALKLKPLSSTLLNYRAECYFKMRDYKRAEADMTDAIALSPKKYSFYCVRGAFRQGSGATAAAIEDYTAALADPLVRGLAYASRAKAYRSLGKVALAERDERAAAAVSKTIEVDLFKP